MRWWISALLLAALPAYAAPSDPIAKCLNSYDLECAHERYDDTYGDSESSEARHVRGWVRFHEGAYEEAMQLIEGLLADGVDVLAEEPGVPYAATAAAAGGMVSADGPGVQVRYSPGVDLVLVDDALETLQASRTVYDEMLGGGPGHVIVLDIFPTVTRFIGASGLPAESVRTTGVVALSKWTRLLLTSPRALSRGYGWKDTVAHEYIHLVVAFRTRNRAPVWMQEGLARHLETRWRGDSTLALSPHTQSLLAAALDADEFVPFSKFAQSMAYLDSGEEAALAFAQVSTMIAYLLERSGEEVLPELMDRVAGGEDPGVAISSLADHADFAAFESGWKSWLRGLPLLAGKLSAAPVVFEGEGSDEDADPLLSARPDLARLSRVGDLLREAGRFEAALIEYEKATDPEGPPSPLLMTRRARCYLGLGEPEKALALMDEAVTLYPELSLVQVTRAGLLESAGRTEDAAAAWRAAHDVNPYDPAVQDGLVRTLSALGRTDAANRHLRYSRILASGGGWRAPSTPDAAPDPAAPPADPARESR